MEMAALEAGRAIQAEKDWAGASAPDPHTSVGLEVGERLLLHAPLGLQRRLRGLLAVGHMHQSNSQSFPPALCPAESLPSAPEKRVGPGGRRGSPQLSGWEEMVPHERRTGP